ncbi:uncharacterized protein LOC111901483 [Lactuca sativa]|uniref:uncharacterized protein LOC111901483 n=1 Tax=Lactuca sativa TaxID=4236 RepID=UPI000CD8031C|nr:uncharacterized protein LOC111901483 [Lactuca sativa]
MNLFDDSDDDDMFVSMMYEYCTNVLLQPNPAPILARHATLNRDHEEGHIHLVHDYFADDCVYQPRDFKRRFRLRKNVFVRIANALENRYEFFQTRDARRKRGFTGLQKCVAAIKLMEMRESPHSIDDYMRMSKRTARESLYRLVRGVVETFGDVYLRKPSLNDIQQLYATHEERHDFPGMLGNIDCTHWDRRNCPVAWKGQYASGQHGTPLLSPIFDDISSRKAPDAPFTVNVNEYKFGYYLTDEIYPAYSTFVKTSRHPVTSREKLFKRKQKGARKDVKRAFGVLKSK